MKVRTNNTSSHSVEIQNGVPESSVLSVTLFLIAINEVMIQITPPVKTFHFAYNLTIICKRKNMQTTQKTLQLVLNKLYEWANLSGFKFSEAKTENIIFTKQNKPSKIDLYLGNTMIRQVNNVKILGIIFNPKVTWKSHS